MEYIIGSGWWCAGAQKDHRAELLGDDDIRSNVFHRLWYQAVDSYSDPEKIIIVDSCSPVKPNLNADDTRVQFVSLNINAGHSTNHAGKFCGYTRAILVALEYAAQCNAEYFVYVEQDCLLFGDGIIEQCIESMTEDFMYGSGEGTPGILQQSFFIIKTSAIAGFIKRLKSISYADNEMSPEDKFHIASSQFGGQLLAMLYRKRKDNSFFQFINWQLFKYLRRWQELPIGYGRCRPIKFEDTHYYFQHGDRDEIDSFCEHSGLEYGK